jgi:hypothetical protein
MRDRQRTFKRRASLSVSEHFFLVLGTPLLLLFFMIELVRVARALMGEPLLITGLPQLAVTVEWSDDAVLFVAGLLMHVVIITFVGVALLSQMEKVRDWLRCKGG